MCVRCVWGLFQYVLTCPYILFLYSCILHSISIRTVNIAYAEVHLTHGNQIRNGIIFHAVATHPGLKMADVKLAQFINV